MAWESPQESFEGLDLGALETDQAYLRVNWAGEGPAYLYWLSGNCHGCPWQFLRKVETNDTALEFHTHHATKFMLRKSEVNYITTEDAVGDDWICDVSAELGEFGVYDFKASEDTCEISEALAPVLS